MNCGICLEEVIPSNLDEIHRVEASNKKIVEIKRRALVPPPDLSGLVRYLYPFVNLFDDDQHKRPAGRNVCTYCIQRGRVRPIPRKNQISYQLYPED